MQAYADDISGWWVVDKGVSGDEIGAHISQRVSEWARQWEVQFNPTKCSIMAIGRVRDPPPTFSLGGTLLETASCLQCLGVLLDSKLTWAAHIRRVSQ